MAGERAVETVASHDVHGPSTEVPTRRPPRNLSKHPGILPYVLVFRAAEHSVPLLLVPCCHSRKSEVLEVVSPFAYNLYEDMAVYAGSGVLDPAGRLGAAQMTALENAGMDVEEVFLLIVFTRKNRLIMGHPGRTPIRRPLTDTAGVADEGCAAGRQGGG